MGRKCITSRQGDKVFDKTLQKYTSRRQIFRLSTQVAEILAEVDEKSQFIRDAIVFYHTYKDRIKVEQKLEFPEPIESVSKTVEPEVITEIVESDSSPGTWVPPWKRS